MTDRLDTSYHIAIMRPREQLGFQRGEGVLLPPTTVQFDELVVSPHHRGGVTVKFAGTSYTLGKESAHEFASQIHRLADDAERAARRYTMPLDPF